MLVLELAGVEFWFWFAGVGCGSVTAGGVTAGGVGVLSLGGATDGVGAGTGAGGRALRAFCFSNSFFIVSN